MKTWRCGCIEGQLPICQQHKTAVKRGMLRRNKNKQAKYGIHTQGFGDTYTQHKK